MRNLKPASGNPQPTARNHMEADLRAIAADLRDLHTALDADIADRREPHPRPPDRAARSSLARRL
jgi:hypothetical protein